MAFDPAQVGRKLIAVGEGQTKTGNKLKSAADELRGVAAIFDDNARVDRALGAIETATRSLRNLVSLIANAFHSVASGLDSITVPSIDPDSRVFDIPVIGRVRLVTGVDISSARPFRPIGASVEAVADNLDNIRVGLLEIANGARDLQEQLPAVKTGILNGADEMAKGGQDLVAAGTAMEDAGNLLAS